MPKYHVYITRTTTYEVIGANREVAMDKALTVDCPEIDRVTESIRTVEADHADATMVYHQSPGEIPHGGMLSAFPSRAHALRALRDATATPSRVLDDDLLEHLSNRGHIIRMEPLP